VIKNYGLECVDICLVKCVLSVAADPTGLRNEPLDDLGQLQRRVLRKNSSLSFHRVILYQVLCAYSLQYGASTRTVDPSGSPAIVSSHSH
jgi:hypothetical protein